MNLSPVISLGITLMFFIGALFQHDEVKAPPGVTGTRYEGNSQANVAVVDRDTDPFDAHRVDVVLPVCNRPGNGVSAACDPLATTFSHEPSDTNCRNYLADVCNWYRIAAVRSRDRTSRPNRTKFLIHYRDRRVRSMLRLFLDVPLMNDINEAASEMYSYFTDRILGLNYIPPTGWARDVPVDYLRALQATAPKHTEHLGHFIRAAGDKSHMSGSVQLWMSNAVPFASSRLRNVFTDSSDATPVREWLNSESNNDDTVSVVGENKPFFLESLYQMSDIFAFDFITGQQDRSLRTNLFVLNGCSQCSGEPRITMINNDKSFCPSICPSFHDDSPYDAAVPDRHHNICRYRPSFEDAVIRTKFRLATDIENLAAKDQAPIHKRPITIASNRLNMLASHVERCRSKRESAEKQDS